MKLTDINLVEQTRPQTPRPNDSISQAEWDDLVNRMGEAEAQKQVREQDPNHRRQQSANSVQRAQDAAAIEKAKLSNKAPGAYGTAEYNKSTLDLKRMRAQGTELRDTMSRASIAGLSPNQLGQVGQMSSVWQPKNGSENHQAQPGEVQLTGNKQQPSPRQVQTPHPGQQPHQAQQNANIALAKQNGFSDVQQFYQALKQQLQSPNPAIRQRANQLLMQLKKNAGL